MHLQGKCQISDNPMGFKVTIDSIFVLGNEKIDKLSSDIFTWQKAYITYEFINPFEKKIKWLPGISYPFSPVDGLRLQVESYSDSLKNYFPLKINENIFAAPKEVKFEELAPHTKIVRSEQAFFYASVKNLNRIRLTLKLAKYNENITDCISNWIDLKKSNSLKH